MKRDEGLILLREVVEENKTHQDYERVTKLADKYFKLFTGNGIEKLLQQVVTRETDEEFLQRTNITKSVCPSILNSTKLPFQKATRKPPRVRKIDFGTESEQKKTELEGFIAKYWGDKSLEKFLEYAFVDYNYTDPNAFLITEFGEFDNLKEKAQPYPFIASSAEAIMFEYPNEILDYLIVRLPITYIDKGSPQPGFKYTMYLGQDTIELVQVSEDEKMNNDVIEIAKKYYLLTYYEPKNEKVPAIRFGYNRDTETKGRTFVSIFHPVMAYLEKTLKIDSELDLSTAMTAFPQRFSYVTPCNNAGCYKGLLADNSICPVCSGTGIQPFHRGTMDIITLALPKNPEEMVDLDNMLVYKAPPIELLTFQKDYIEYLKISVQNMLFNADPLSRSEVTQTATEVVNKTDNLNDTLYPFAQHYSSVWEFVVKDIATFTDLVNGLIVQFKFPNDFKMKSLQELMFDLKSAKDSTASSSTIAAIEDDINELLYSDRPDDLKRIRIKNNLNPYRGNSEADVKFIISQNNVPLYTRTLWENFESIFQDLEQEHESPWLYDMNENAIRELVKAKTEEYVKTIKAETPEPVINQPFQ
jgi:hypothetical protein